MKSCNGVSSLQLGSSFSLFWCYHPTIAWANISDGKFETERH